MMLLPHFWARRSMCGTPAGAQVFPLLGGCGLVGVCRRRLCAWATPIVGRDGLMWSLSVLLIVAHLLTRVIEKAPPRRPGPIDVLAYGVRLGNHTPVVIHQVLAVASRCRDRVDARRIPVQIFIQKMYPDRTRSRNSFGKFYLRTQRAAWCSSSAREAG